MHELYPFFAALRADHVVLEAARHDTEDLKILGELDNLRFGIGVIDVKDTGGDRRPGGRADRAGGLLAGLAGADRL
ncbi:MAG: hypothetical protein QOG96_1901, partial [Pseudonocardiales bacterium]|nr:hypothetical protein [Pseudonocardiales bacterium]